MVFVNTLVSAFGLVTASESVSECAEPDHSCASGSDATTKEVKPIRADALTDAYFEEHKWVIVTFLFAIHWHWQHEGARAMALWDRDIKLGVPTFISPLVPLPMQVASVSV
jgi:hypothetical protein